MNLQETKTIVASWISSAATSEQLELLKEVIEKFVFERFADQDPTELKQAQAELEQTWMDRKLIVARKRKKIKP